MSWYAIIFTLFYIMEFSWNYRLREFKLFTNDVTQLQHHKNSFVSNENSTPETSELIYNLESKLLLRFDNLDKEMVNLKDGIIKDWKDKNQ